MEFKFGKRTMNLEEDEDEKLFFLLVYTPDFSVVRRDYFAVWQWQ
jgi:hypothetical protein